MISLQTNLTNFKTRARSELHSLQTVEIKLDEEIKIYNKKLVEWEEKVRIPHNSLENYEIANKPVLEKVSIVDVSLNVFSVIDF